MSNFLMLVRHGETVGNNEEIAHGQSESPLNERGLSQAVHTANLLKNWERNYNRVYASPLSRALQTATTISDALGLPLEIHDDLKEGFLGDLEGVTYRELGEFGYARHSISDDDFDGHNGESPRVLSQRMYRAIADIRGRHTGENIIVVSHGAAIAHALAALLGTTPLFGPKYLMHNTAVTELAFEPEPSLVRLNYHDHLPEDLRAPPSRPDGKRHA